MYWSNKDLPFKMNKSLQLGLKFTNDPNLKKPWLHDFYSRPSLDSLCSKFVGVHLATNHMKGLYASGTSSVFLKNVMVLTAQVSKTLIILKWETWYIKLKKILIVREVERFSLASLRQTSFTFSSAVVLWCAYRISDDRSLNIIMDSHSDCCYIIVFITIIVIFHHFVFAQKQNKKKQNKFFRSWSPLPTLKPTTTVTVCSKHI